MSNPFSNLGVSIAQAAKGFAALRAIGSSVGWPEFFDIEERDTGYLITYYRPDQHCEIAAWLKSYGMTPQTVNGLGYHVFDCPADIAILAKLTFGGAA